jgi:nitronate monooxygenase
MQDAGIPPLIIGDLEVNPPIIQGGMGVRVSKANLAAAVAKEGCVGVISTVGLGEIEGISGSEFVRLNEQALRAEIRKARSLTDGIIGVNVMAVLSHYESLTTTAADEGVDLVVSGAGLPLDLPGLVQKNHTKLIPIVSSARALSIICRKWKRYGRVPDAVVVEGAKAGGHLGFGYEKLLNGNIPSLDEILAEVIEFAESFAPPFPVIAAGGIFDGRDIARVLRLGASGVQMATRFVCTDECDVHQNFKQAYINAREEDMTVIKSPVGMPGRVINNAFVEKIKRGETVPFTCAYQCLRGCDPMTAPYCIAKVLLQAAEGNMDEAFAFAGENAYRCTEIVPVKQLIGQLAEETAYYLSKDAE